MRVRVLIMLAIAAIMLAGCSSDDATPAPGTGTAVPTATGSPSAAPSATGTVVIGPPEPFDDTSSAVSTLASLYNALNRGDLERAYTYYDPAPTASFDEYRQAYADFQSALVVVEPPGLVSGEGASMTSQVPTLLYVTNKDASTQVFAGCFTLRPGQRDPDSWYVAESTLIAQAETEPKLGLLDGEGGCDSRVGPDAPLDDTSSPAALMASLVNALNRKEFDRAFRYWATPPDGQSLAQYKDGFAETEGTLIAIAPPQPFISAAGNERAEVGALLAITRTNGDIEYFAGCYVARRPAGDPAAPWRLVDRSVFAVEAADARGLLQICAG